MTYPPDPNNPQNPSEPQSGYYQQPEAGHYQQPDPGQYQHPDPGQYPPTAGFQAPTQPGQGKNFFASLFDFSFRSFITPNVIQIYYVVGLVLLGIGVLFGLISAVVTMASEFALLGLLQLIMVPIIGFVYLLLLRMMLELVANFFRIGDDIRAMRDKSDRTP